jgi:hypothetical protein
MFHRADFSAKVQIKSVTIEDFKRNLVTLHPLTPNGRWSRVPPAFQKERRFFQKAPRFFQK